ncbi:3-deoxy-manno-octulosonate cytidylyltransferase [Aureibaculum marinum]|uniref:3-deoxy-manno-octulosonate cytidylyltransferase n=3 Tax=Pseudomonadati TaxID=3379134 RepID=A0A3N4NPF0_9FLAO|nr:3-deoxy-manno-octulosonate cytidylyltransferase [Aureibaculum marinum]
MNILGIIPARYGSTRLEGKPLLDICGKPMIQHVYEQVKKVMTNVLVATDDERIERVVKSFGGNVVMTSDKHNTGTNRCLEAYKIFKSKFDIDFDVVINIQGDEPLLEPEQIRQLISCFEEDTTEMATLVIPVKSSENLFNGGVFVVMDKNNNALYFSRSVIPYVRDANKDNWQKQHTFYKHVGMYGFTPKALNEFANLSQTSLEIAESLEQNRWLENGNKIKVAKTEFETIAVDTLEDLKKVRQMIK